VITLTLLTRPNCALCDEFKHELSGLLAQVNQPFEWHEQNVDDDPVLCRRFGLEIPVLLYQGERIAGVPLDTAALQQLLAKLVA